MREAKSGVYCGPLRLLAMEVFDSVNQQVASLLYLYALVMVWSVMVLQ